MRNIKTTLLHKWFQKVWNEENNHAIDEMLSEECIAHGAGENSVIGTEGFRAFYNGFKEQFSNIQVTVEDVVSEDDLEVARCIVTAEHKSSGKKVEFVGMCMAKISNGKMVEAWNNYDFLNMNQQLGFILTQA